MPNPEFKPEDEFRGGHDSSDSEEDHSELKALVDGIAAQLSDATRRHSQTLGEMQDRIALMGREAEALREHIPEQYAPTFEHIEAGVAELAKRLAKANESDAAYREANPWDRTSAEALTDVYESDARSSVQASPAVSAAPARAPDIGLALLQRVEIGLELSDLGLVGVLRCAVGHGLVSGPAVVRRAAPPRAATLPAM